MSSTWLAEVPYNIPFIIALIIVAETSEDISPYATFQLSEASTLAQTHHLAPTNTLLHSFMYHERAMTEGCASPPTAAAVRRTQNNKSPYYNVVGYLSSYLIGQLCILFGIRFLFCFLCLTNIAHGVPVQQVPYY